MSYPAPRYLGDTGEVSARTRRASHPPEIDDEAPAPFFLRHDTFWV